MGIEHDDTNGADVAALFAARRVFGDVAEHPDLAGKPRFVVARRIATDVEAQRAEAAGEDERMSR